MIDYSAHVQQQQQLWQQALTGSKFDAVIITAGRGQPYLFDDQHPPFRANPHFMRWVPFADAQGSALTISSKGPVLHFLQEDDYWHQPPQLPDWIGNQFQVQMHTDSESLVRLIRQAISTLTTAHIGSDNDNAWSKQTHHNPASLLTILDFARAYKTPFELGCLREAADQAVVGHNAAAKAFLAEASEYDIHIAYLKASRQTEADLPYPNIIALNHHAGVLHYQHQDRAAPKTHRSFLIDAGARKLGYAADISRSYAGSDTKGSALDFQALLTAMEQLQQRVLASLRKDEEFEVLHEQTHHLLADLLIALKLAKGSAESLVEGGITTTFLPHGLGHLVGLQTHDVAGHMRSADGTIREPKPKYPTLRLTRPIEAGMVFTIEPGIYFIPMLLAQLRNSPAGKSVNWSAVDQLTPYGGIRIEDNVHVSSEGIENLTRDAFARHT